MSSDPPAAPPADVRRARFSVVWLVPIIAAVLAGYLGYRTLMARGPLLELTFKTAEGLTAGQTQVKYKAMALGTVESLDLAPDNSHVIVEVRMNQTGARFLTSHARFWVVRPNFNGGNVSGLETLVSGAYIAVDPGPPGGKHQTKFTGLEDPPGVTSDEPGHTYVLKADELGSLGTGSPVFYRDVVVGEVLGYDLGSGVGPITVSVFVRSPYDDLVRRGSHFWNSSGITAQIQNGTFHVEFQSLQAILSGGVTFNMPPQAMNSPVSPSNAVFTLYPSEDAADAAGYLRRIPVVTYLDSSVNGLAPGAPVQILGIEVGEVTDVRLVLDPANNRARARVEMQLQPERVFKTPMLPSAMTLKQGLQGMVDHGLRAQLSTSNLVTGQQVITLTRVKDAAPVEVTQEQDGAFVIPSTAGPLDHLLKGLSGISAKLQKIPFDQIGENLNKLLVTTNGTLASPEIKQSLAALSATLKTTNQTLQSLNETYGSDSDFNRNLTQLMGQANDTLRSLDMLTNYLDRHPNSILFGRRGQ